MAKAKAKATKATTKKVADVKEVKEEIKVEAPKAEAVVEEAPKAEVKVEEVSETVEEAPKAEAVVEEAPKAEAKKAPAKKATTKKAAAKSETVVTVQFQGKEVAIATVEERVKAQFVAEGNKESAIKTLNIYVKPEELSAYYVINGDVTGRVDLF